MVIYCAKNSINGKCYVGQTRQKLNIRISQHCYFAFTKKSTDPFHRALCKYGKDIFKWSVLHISNNQDDLNKMECLYIERLDSLASNRTGYNVRGGGNNGILSKATRLKISKARKGTKHNQKTKNIISEKTKGKNNPRYINLSPELESELYNDFISCQINNKELEIKYNMSRPTIYRKIKKINPNLGDDFKRKRYKSLNKIRTRRMLLS